jgi:transcriptional regulator with XRE-family HTH domain
MSTSNQDMNAIIKVLKQTLRARNYVYADVALHLGVSEVTIKRFFSGTSISAKYLLDICDFLQVSFLEIAAIARDFIHNEYILNETQDLFFAKNPHYYSIFISLYRRKPAIVVQKDWKLDDSKFFLLLRKLEKIQLLEVLPNNGFRFLMSGPIRVRPNGEFRKIFYKHNHQFLDYVQNNLNNNLKDPQPIMQSSEVLLSKKHAADFLQEFQELAKKYRSLAFVDETILPDDQKESVRWLFAYAPYETNWSKE